MNTATFPRPGKPNALGFCLLVTGLSHAERRAIFTALRAAGLRVMERTSLSSFDEHTAHSVLLHQAADRRKARTVARQALKAAGAEARVTEAAREIEASDDVAGVLAALARFEAQS